MLKHKDKIDILEDYCGEHSSHFEWAGQKALGPKGSVWSVEAKINSFSLALWLVDFHKDENSSVQLNFRTTSTGKWKKLFKRLIADPKGKNLCEEKIGLVVLAMELDEV